MYYCNEDVAAVNSPPIPAAKAWLCPAAHGDDRPLLDLSQAVPDYPPPEPVQQALRTATNEPSTALYTDITGLPALRETFADHQSTFYGSTIAADEVAITAGCNQAFCATMQTLARAGDDVIVPLPYYFNHQMWLDILGIRTQHIPFDPDTAGIPDIDAFAKRIGPRTRAIMIVSPNNPTGTVWPEDVLHALLDLALSRNIALVIDETYKDFHPDGGQAHQLFKQDLWPAGFIQLYSFSKAYSLTGHRVGAVTASRAFLSQLAKVLDCSQICAPHVGQLAAQAGVQLCRDFVESKKQLMASRAQVVHQVMKHDPGGFKLVSCGAYFAYLAHPFIQATGDSTAQASDTIAQSLAQQQNVLTLPGSMFGPMQQPWLRVAFANVDSDALTLFAQRLEEFSDTVTMKNTLVRRS